MNTHRTDRTGWTFNASFVAVLLLALTLVATIAQPARAQVGSGQLLATQFFDAIGGGTSLYMMSANAVLHSPEGNYSGRDGLALFGDDLEASFSDLTFTTNSVEQVDGLTIIRFTMTGTSTGTYHGITANCAGIKADGVAVLQVSTQTFATESWVDGAMSQELDLPEVSTQELVVEQWIGYNAAAITSQIADFNQWAPNTAFGCANHASDSLVPAPAPEPVYPGPNQRELPF